MPILCAFISMLLKRVYDRDKNMFKTRTGNIGPFYDKNTGLLKYYIGGDNIEDFTKKFVGAILPEVQNKYMPADHKFLDKSLISWYNALDSLGISKYNMSDHYETIANFLFIYIFKNIDKFRQNGIEFVNDRIEDETKRRRKTESKRLIDNGMDKCIDVFTDESLIYSPENVDGEFDRNFVWVLRNSEGYFDPIFLHVRENLSYDGDELGMAKELIKEWLSSFSAKNQCIYIIANTFPERFDSPDDVFYVDPDCIGNIRICQYNNWIKTGRKNNTGDPVGSRISTGGFANAKRGKKRLTNITEDSFNFIV